MSKNFSFLAVALLLIIQVVFFTTCQKEYSYEGGVTGGSSSGTAVYTFSGAGGACSAAIINGTYYAGVGLDATNSVQLQVNVTTAGTYIVSTNVSNGIKFSASGSFANTGIQFIKLTGNGTPTNEGNGSFFTPATSACSFTVIVTRAPPAIADFTLAGTPNSCTNASVNGRYHPGVNLDITNSVDIAVNVTAPGLYNLSTDTIDGISFSAAGTFTNTGTQTITLSGLGTPDIARNLTFTPLAATSSCTFKVAVVPPDPAATYVLESVFGTPNPCNYTVAGTYTAGTPLTVANTITLKTFVTVAGNFAIATDVVNGMLFTYTGIFTTTGVQFVTLQGSGTPLTAGSFSLIPQIVGPHPIGGESCGVSITVH